MKLRSVLRGRARERPGRGWSPACRAQRPLCGTPGPDRARRGRSPTTPRQRSTGRRVRWTHAVHEQDPAAVLAAHEVRRGADPLALPQGGLDGRQSMRRVKRQLAYAQRSSGALTSATVEAGSVGDTGRDSRLLARVKHCKSTSIGASSKYSLVIRNNNHRVPFWTEHRHDWNEDRSTIGAEEAAAIDSSESRRTSSRRGEEVPSSRRSGIVGLDHLGITSKGACPCDLHSS